MTTAGRLGRYDLLRRLAAGGMGEVYLAQSEGAANFTKQVAIKRILPHLARDEGFVRKFIDEAHLMVQLHHGNIVPVLELADDEGELYLVMEYLPGRDLKAVLRRLRADERQMPVDLAVWLVGEVLAGLDYAHRKRGADGESLGVVHRDVSPSNVCLGAGGEVKLVDFGIARARGGLHQSISGTLQGKFVYMSPEQADGQAVDARSDVFSAGLVLYELLTDQRPFEGDTETETLRRVRECKVDPPSSKRDAVPEALDAIVMKALAVDPDDRYTTAGEMRRALSHHLAVSGSEADAGALARFLAEVFPEGVVPRHEAAPRSFDDALLMQLGGSESGSAGTRTASAPAGRAPTGPLSVRTPTPLARTSAPGEGYGGPVAPISGAYAAPPDTGSHPAPPNTGSHPAYAAPYPDGRFPSGAYAGPTPTPVGLPAVPGYTPTGQQPVVGRRRMLALGLLIGLGVAAVALLWPREATVAATFEPAVEGAWVEVDGARLAEGATLTAGRPYRICATAPGHAPDCRQITLSAGVNRPRFELTVAPVLAPVVEPAEVEARITLDGVEIRQPRFPLVAGQTYAVCATAPGYIDACTRLAATAGVNAPRLVLMPVPVADAGVEPDRGPPDAAPSPDAAAKRPIRRPPPKPRTRFVTIDSYTTAEVWQGDRRLGVTPVTVKVERGAITYELRAKGYAPTRHTVRPDAQGGTVKVRLERPAYINLRADPGASIIILDGVEIGVGTVLRHRTTPGRHTLSFRWVDDANGRTYVLGPRTITLEPGETHELGYFNVLRDGTPTGE